MKDLSELTIMEDIKDTLPEKPEYPPYVKGIDELSEIAPNNVKDFENDDTVNLEVLTDKKRAFKAEKFLELIESGIQPHEAAKQTQTTLREVTSGNKEIKGKLKNLFERARLPNEIRKEMVRAALNDILMDNIDGPKKNRKLAIAAAKEIAKDPDVGLNLAPTLGSVTIDMSTFSKLIENQKPIPGLEQILDAEVVEEDTDSDEKTT